MNKMNEKETKQENRQTATEAQTGAKVDPQKRQQLEALWAQFGKFKAQQESATAMAAQTFQRIVELERQDGRIGG